MSAPGGPSPMRLTILETGRPPPALRDSFSDYPQMFAALLGKAAFSFETVAICDGEAPPGPEEIEAVLITGSPAGVYEDHAWIGPLEAAIRAYAARRLPQIGICFGHQIIAQALGGRVEKSPKGWGLGHHAYQLIDPPNWMGEGGLEFSIAASHQDQVIMAPLGARVLAANAHTPIAALHYEAANALTFQGHPEMSPAFLAALLAARRGRIPEAALESGLASLAQQPDRARVARWIEAFVLKNPAI